MIENEGGKPPSQKALGGTGGPTDRDSETIPPSHRVSETSVSSDRAADSSSESDPTIAFSSEVASLQDSHGALATWLATLGGQFGDYELLGEIARGGMGVVFKARQRRPKRIVALKMILSGMLAGESEVKRFLAEAEAAANLDHPGIVPIFEVGEHGGQQFFSMGFVEGQSLAAKISDGPLESRAAAELLLKICDATQYAHDNGVIHRDLKPSNVLLDKKGRPRVTDFGLAKQVRDDSDLTGSDQILGTPSYMPPEQAAGKTGQIGPAADVYALGAILYALVTGRPPFQAASQLDTLLMVLDTEPVPPRKLNPRVPRDLETICLKCLRKEPHRRYRTARGVGEELQRFLDGKPIVARPIGVLDRTWRWCRRNRVVAALIGAAAVLATLVVAVSIVAYVQTNLALGRERQQRALAQNREREAQRARAAADVARDAADVLRIEAERERDVAEKNLYIANVRLGLSAMNSLETERLTHLLKMLEPKPGRPDLRGWEWYYLRSVYQRSVLSKHEVRLAPGTATLAWSPGVDHLAAVQADGTLVVFEQPSGKERLKLADVRATAVVYHPQGTHLATGSSDGTIVIWNAESGEAQTQFPAHSAPISAMAFHPDGKQILSGCRGGHAVIHDVATGRVSGEVRISGDVRGVAWSPSGKEFAAGTGDHELNVWNTETRAEVFHLTDYGEPVFTMSWSPDGRYFGLAGWNGVRTWTTDAWVGNERLGLHDLAVRAMAWSPDGRTLAAGTDHWSLVLFDVETGNHLQTLRTHQDWITTVSWNRDGTLLASASKDGTVQIHASETKHERRLIDSGPPLWAVAWSPDATRVAAGGEDRMCRIWDVSTGEISCVLGEFRSVVRGIDWSPDGSRIAVATYEPNVRLFDANSGEELSRLKQITDWVVTSQYSPDGSRLASLDWGGKLMVHDAAGARELWRVAAHKGRGDSAAWSPDGRYIATGGADGLVRVSYASGRPAAVFRGHTGEMGSVAWSPDGTVLASGGLDGTVRIWDVGERRELRVLRGHTGGVFQIAWHPDGHRLASASADQSCKLWDVEFGQEVLSLRSAAGSLFALDWSSDGRQIVAAGSGGCVTLWDASLGYGDEPSVKPAGTPNADRVARLLVDALFDELYLREAVSARIRSDTSLDEAVRSAALSLAETADENLFAMNNDCWSVVSRPDRSAEQYARALPVAEALQRSRPHDPVFSNTVGVAFYRAGRDDAAIGALEQSSRILSQTPEGDNPGNLAFRALASHRLGRRPEALALLGQLRSLMQQPRWADDGESLDFLHETQWQLIVESRPWSTLDPVEVTSLLTAPQQGATLRELDDHSLLAGGANPPHDAYRIVARTGVRQVHAIRLDALPHDDLPSNGPGRLVNGVFELSRLSVQVSADGTDSDQPMAFRHALAEYSRPGHDPRSVAGFVASPGWSNRRDEQVSREESIVLEFARPLTVGDGALVTVTLEHTSQVPTGNLGRFRLSVTDSPMAIPSSADLRPAFARFGLDPRQQGPRNTCSVLVVTEALEFALSTRTSRGIRLSPEYLNWACNQVVQNQTDDRGQFFHDLLRGFEHYGISLEADMPYRNRFDPSLAPSDAARNRAMQIRREKLEVHWINPWSETIGLSDDDMHEIKQTIAAGWPVCAGSSHSLLLVGYRDDPDSPHSGTFIALDTGTGSYTELTYDTVKKRMADVFWIGL